MIRTTCAYCGVGCGLTVNSGSTLAGDPKHPANFGRLCAKGASLLSTLGHDERLIEPSIRGRSASWDEALDGVAKGFQGAIATHGSQSVAMYISGQLLTEDYYAANKLMKGFIGSANIDTNSRLCMASSVAAHIRAFGEDVVPGTYEDLDECELCVIAGSNLAWCHPVLHQRLLAARETLGTKIVVIDPRRTATAEAADLHLQIRAGADVLLFNALLEQLDACGATDRKWVAEHVCGFDEALATARPDPANTDEVASALDIDRAALEQFFDWFVRTERVVTIYSQGINQSDHGTDKVSSIINCHLATARIGRPGMGPFSVTGQPNAMGGREVGGLANQLAAHMDFSNPENVDRVRRFWHAPNITTGPGLKAVDMFQAVADGRIRAIWIAGTNPAASMPNATLVRNALEHCPLVVVSDCWPTDTTAYAHVVLPAAGWAEKNGTVTNSERRISRQRNFCTAPGNAMPDWWMFAEIGRRMGWQDAFSFDKPAAIFREHATLSAFENGGTRLFDIGGLADLGDAGYDALQPTQWPFAKTGQSRSRLFADGIFPTADRRARMIATPARLPKPDPGVLRLNTGRIRDQWHTMTRTGRVPELMSHSTEPLLDIHPADAAAIDLQDGGLAQIETPHGRSIMRVRMEAGQRRSEIFVPMHWSDSHSSAGPVARLVNMRTDPLSGQPDLKATEAKVVPLHEQWHGILLQQASVTPCWGEGVYWTRAPLKNGMVARLAGWHQLQQTVHSEEQLRSLMAVAPDAELIAYIDPAKSVFRYAGVEHGALVAVLFLAPAHDELPATDTIAPLIGTRIEPRQRLSLLAGVAGHAVSGKLVCVCFSVGEHAIHDAIGSGQVRTMADIAAQFGAGTNCGGCIPELKELLHAGKPRSPDTGTRN